MTRLLAWIGRLAINPKGELAFWEQPDAQLIRGRIVGTDIAHAVPLTLIAGMGHATMGVVDYNLLGSLLLGSIPGIALGSHLAFRLPERRMKQTLAVILIFVGGKLSEAGRIAEYLCEATADEIVPAVKKVLDAYLEHRRNADELFVDFCERIGIEPFRDLIK